jgi:zona occludens toxin (predicted ATPase)
MAVKKTNKKERKQVETDSAPAQSNGVRGYFSKLKHPSQFSKPQLAMFVIAFGLIGYFIYHSFAAASVVATLQGEQMTAQLAVATGANNNVSQSGSSQVSLAASIKFINISLPTLSGIAIVGNTLTVSNGTWNPTPTSYSYAWFRCNSSGSSCTHSPTSTSNTTYIIQPGDKGYTIRTQVAPNGEWNRSKDTKPTAVVTSAQPASQTLHYQRFPARRNSALP